MKSDNKLPSLPPALERDIADLRAQGPSSGFEERLRAALADADRDGAQAAAAAPAPSRSPWLFIAPSMAIVAALLLTSYVLWRGNRDSVPANSHVEEHHVELTEGEDAWLGLDLWTANPDDPMLVHVVETPSSVSLHQGEERQNIEPKDCQGERCVHHVEHEGVGESLLMRIPAPGRYEIRVEHTSANRKVLRQVVVHARD